MAELPTSLDINDILKILPHRFPFALVDSVEKIDRSANSKNREGHTIVAYKNVTMNEPHFAGHFPEYPIVPGVLIIESLAQACGLLAYRKHPEGGSWKFHILGISKAKFRKPTIPGDRLRLECKMTKDKGAIMAFECKAYCSDGLQTEAEILAQMKP